MNQLRYEELCQLIGRTVLEYETKLKNLFEQYANKVEELEALKAQNGQGTASQTSE
jgi:hypothetical protein